jgi:hypothetical protein
MIRILGSNNLFYRNFNLFALLIKAIDFQDRHFEITVHIHQVTKAGQGGDYGENSEPPEV